MQEVGRTLQALAEDTGVLVYDNRHRVEAGQDAWANRQRQIARLAANGAVPHDDLIAALISFGEFESGVADALCPTEDDSHPTLIALRNIAECLGRAAASAVDGDDAAVAGALRAADAACGRLEPLSWPDIRVTVPEGYAYYSLYPETYADAVVNWVDGERPPRVLAIGLRSIGASLSAIVTGALQRRGVPTASWTLRPQGHPFDRHVALTRDLVARLDPISSVVLIVDEGPGLSGSSLTGTAAALSALGVTDDRILFVPSWNPSPEGFVSPSAQARWPRHRAILPSFDRIRSSLAEAGVVPADAREVSAGAWREWLRLPQPWPAAQPQHERRKYVFESRVARFAGLGEYGHGSAGRAEALHGAGYCARPVALQRGFLTLQVVDGSPLCIANLNDAFLRHASTYVAWLRCHASTSRTASVAPLAEMLLTNTREALGAEWLPAAEALARDATAFAEPSTAVDGRMQPHEWLAAAPGQWIKTDALDHHRDHFLPGCTDAAWDVAGMMIEFGRGGDILVAEYARRSGDRLIAQRLPFFVAAYSAFRAGYCAIAAQALAGTDDGARFERLGSQYRDALRTTLGNVRPAAPSVP